ncbi:MAG: TIGR01906 family membrane protein [Clostridia bacterium]|nr:TIGR01906 family membrane protein [Clostridia bacterium]
MKKTGVLHEVSLGIEIGLCTLLLATGAALLLLHSCDLLYRLDLKLLKIPEQTGLDVAVILENYHAMMAYLNPFSKGSFSLPTLAFSAEGAQHFADCRRLFLFFYVLAFAAGLLLVLRAFRSRGEDKSAVRYFVAAVVLIGSVLLAGIAIGVNPSRSFVLFHKLLFRNDYWLFDPVRDPVILLLPEQFFYHCAAVFACFWGMGALLLLQAGIREKKKREQGKQS